MKFGIRKKPTETQLNQLNYTHRAREIAVFNRLGQKMNCKALSRPEVLTAEIRMTIFSSPWNSSTVPTVTFLNFFNPLLIVLTCAKYGEMIPISSGATFCWINLDRKRKICMQMRRNHFI